MSSSRNNFRLMLCFLCLLLTSFDLQAFAETQGNAIATETHANTSYTVRFYTEAGGTPLSTQTIEEGQTITVLPEAPFKAGSHFVGWNTRADGTGDPVVIGYTVNADVDVYAIFNEIKIYKATLQYWYSTAQGGQHIFETQIIEFESPNGDHIINCPSNVNQDNTITGDLDRPVYYPEEPTVTITQSDFATATYNSQEGVYELPTRQVKYVPFTATYNFVYMLKNLDGNGYTEFDRQNNIEGVLGSMVAATIKEYDYATYERTEPTQITQVSGQEIPVYYTRNMMTLTYDVQGGKHIDEQTHPYRSTIPIVSTAERTGYTFQGWYDAAEGGSRITGNVTLERDMTLYAHWKGNTVNYTIVYMYEKYNDAGTIASYVYDNSETRTAQAGSTVYANNAPTKNKTGWEKDTERNNTSSVVVAADGSSILNVYYKLSTYTFQFNAGTYSTGGWGSRTYDVTATLVEENISGTGTLSYTMTVKLGQDISNLWPSNVTGYYTTWTNPHHDVTFNGWMPAGSSTRYVTKRPVVTDDMLPSSGNSITYTAQWSSSGTTYTVNYWLQNADDDDYTKSEKYSQTFSSNSGNLTAKEIPGYTHDHDQNSGNTYNFYYNRERYEIKYFYGGTSRRTISDVKFDATITDATYNWTPSTEERTAWGVDDDYTWAGWYADAALTTPYEFTTMPSAPLAVYGKFTAPSYTVSFDVNGGTGSIASQTVEKGKTATYPAIPIRANYSFTGWFTDQACTQRYSFITPVTEDIPLYAGWRANPLTYIVHYYRTADHAEVFPNKTVTSALLSEGQIITEDAVNIVGYTPDAGSKQVTLFYNQTNEITFYYTQRSTETTSYRVQYVLASDNSVKIHADKNVTNVDGNTVSVMEMAVEQDNSWMESNGFGTYTNEEYYPLNDLKTLILSSDVNANVLTFEYTNYKTATLTVNFHDMDGNTLKPQETHHPRIGDTYYADSENLTGWSFDHVIASNGSTASQYVTTDNSDVTIDIYYKKQLTILAKDLEKVYDGTPLQSEGTDHIRTDGLQNGHTLYNISFSGSQTDVGESATTPHDAVITGPTSGANYYDIEYLPGKLTITPATVNITIDPDRWTGNYYKGSSYKAGFTNSNKQDTDYVKISNATYKTQYLDIIWSTLMTKFPNGVVIDQTNVGNYTVAGTNVFQQSDLPNSGNNYNITLFVREAQLEIKPVQLTVTTGSGEKTYDGTALTNSEASITGFVNGETATVTATGSLIPAGSIPNSYTIDWGSTLSSNYTINEELGTLTVTPATLTVTVKDRTLNYNGAAQEGYTIATVTGTGSEISNDNYTVTGLAAGDVLTVTYTPASGTDAGTYTNGAFAAEYTIVNADSEDMSGNYETPTMTAGSLTINKIDVAVAIVGENSTVDYDGTEHRVNGYTASTESTLYDVDNDFTFSGTDEAARTKAGTTNMGLAANQFVNTNNNFNVTFNVTDGYQTINPITATVTIIGHNHTDTYDATEHSISGYETTFSTSLYTAADFTFNGNAVAKRTDFGQTDMGLAASQFANTNSNFSTVTFNVTDGYQKIDRAEVTVTADNKTKLYGATDPALTVTITGLQGSDPESIITYSISRVAGEELGNYDINVTGAENQGNYHVTFAKGTFTINGMPQPITIASASESVTYDGQLHKKEVYTVTFDGVTLTPDATGKVFTMPITGDKLTITPTFTGVTNVADANNIDNNNTFTYILENDETYIGTRTITAGTVKIEPATLIVTVAGRTLDHTGETQYGQTITTVTGTGTTISDKAYTVTGLVANDVLTLNYTPASGADKGTYTNGSFAQEYTIVNANNADIKGNYLTPTLTAGQLVILPENQSSTVACAASVTSPSLPTMTDHCGETLILGEPTISDMPDCEGSVTYTYQFEDCAGDGHTWVYTYTIERTTAPAEVDGPVATTSTVHCAANATTPSTLPVVKDVCGNILTASAPIEGGTYNDCEGTKTFTYTYKDCAGLEFVWTYTYTIEAPTLTFTGTITNIENIDACFNESYKSQLKTDEEVKAMFTSSCNRTITVSHEDVTTNNNCDWNIVRTYTITDGGCNTTTKTMSISGFDNTAPVLTGTWPNNIAGINSPLVESLKNNLYSNEQVKALYNDCHEITVTSSDATTGSDCGWTITRTYTIEDECGNKAETMIMRVSGFDKSALPQAEKALSSTGQITTVAEGGQFVNETGSITNQPRLTQTGRLITSTLPTVNTSTINSITSTTAMCEVEITSDGGSALTARGVCWSTQPNPTLTDNAGFTVDGYCTGTFSSELTGLTSGTIYYVRAYATNGMGTSYGEVISFTTK